MNPDGTFSDPAEARTYLSSLSSHVLRLGDTSFLHPDFAVNMANAVKQARSQGLPVTVQSGYRTNNTTGSGYDAGGLSMHGYGAAIDVGGIGGPGSPQAQQWAKIAGANGVYNPYGVNDPKEYNHWQLVPWTLESRPDVQQSIINAHGDIGKIWNAVSPVSQGTANVASAKPMSDADIDALWKGPAPSQQASGSSSQGGAAPASASPTPMSDADIAALWKGPSKPAPPSQGAPSGDPRFPVQPTAPVAGNAPAPPGVRAGDLNAPVFPSANSTVLATGMDPSIRANALQVQAPASAAAPSGPVSAWDWGNQPALTGATANNGFNGINGIENLANTPARVWDATKNAFEAGGAQAAQGAAQTDAGQYWPTLSGTYGPSPSPNLSSSVFKPTIDAGGPLNYLRGRLAQAFSPFTGLTNALVTDPVTNATGSPEIGARAGLLASTAAGAGLTNALGAAAEAVLPGGRAVTQMKNYLGPEASADLAARVANNPNLRLMDVDPEIQAHALGIATRPSDPGFRILQNSVTENAAAARGAVSDAYDSAAGTTPNVKNLLDNLAITARQNADRTYGDAFAGAKPVDISGVVDNLDKVAKPGVNSVVSTPSGIPPSTAQAAATDIKSLLTDENGSIITDPERLHEIQSQLRVAAQREFQRGDMQSTIRGQQLSSARTGIVNALDDATDGKYSVARNQYREDMSIPEAFNKGTEIYKNNTLEDRPEYWDAWKNGDPLTGEAPAAPEEVKAAQIGMRVAADRAINGMRFGATGGTAIADVPFNVDKMRIILGDDETNALVQKLQDAKDQASTNALLTGGSKTTLSTAAQKASAVREQSGPFNLLGAGTAPALIAHYFGTPDVGAALAGGAGLAANYIGRASDIARNTAFARLASKPAQNALLDLYNRRPTVFDSPLAAPQYLLSGSVLGGQGNEPVNALAAPNR